MFDFFFQLFGLFMLLVGVAVGYWLWIRPRENDLNIQGRGLLLLVVLTLMGALVGSPFWWADDERSFSWDLPPLAGRMLAAAAWSFVVVSYLGLRRPSYRRLRLVLVLLIVYLLPLTIAILIFHLDRFDPSAGVTYTFFTIVVVMDVATAWYLLRQPTIQPEQSQDREPTSRIVRLWMLLVGVLLGLWGLALFLSSSGPIGVVWVWSYDPLSTQLIGVMFLAMATGLFYSFRHRDVARVMLGTILVYGVGIAAASFSNLINEKPFPVSYFVVFGVISLVSLSLLVLSKKTLHT
jgi:hypothetical protein